MKVRQVKKNPPSLLGGSKTLQVFKIKATFGNHHRSHQQLLATPLKPLATPLREYGNVTT